MKRGRGHASYPVFFFILFQFIFYPVLFAINPLEYQNIFRVQIVPCYHAIAICTYILLHTHKYTHTYIYIQGLMPLRACQISTAAAAAVVWQAG